MILTTRLTRISLGEPLRKRFLKATKVQIAGLEEFTTVQNDDAPAWKQALDDFESKQSTVNPYELPQSGPNLRDIELELMQEEQEREWASTAMREATEETMTEYLMLGLHIEGQRRELLADLLANKLPTMKELTNFITQCTRLSRQIKKLRLLQCIYSLGTLQWLATTADPVDVPKAERIPLLLVSGLLPRKVTPPLSVPGLVAAEVRLCNDSPQSNGQEAATMYRARNSQHQHQNMCARGIMDGQQEKIDLAAGTYRQARAACITLSHVVGTSSWRALKKADLRLMEDEEAKQKAQRVMKGKRKEASQENKNGEVHRVPGMGEKSRLISWIWHSAGGEGGLMGEEIHGGLKEEWCKAYARVKQWWEEVALLQEEMVCCLLSLKWQVSVWDARAKPSHYTSTIPYRDNSVCCEAGFRETEAGNLTDQVEEPDAAKSSGTEEELALDRDDRDSAEDDLDDDEHVEQASPSKESTQQEVNDLEPREGKEGYEDGVNRKDGEEAADDEGAESMSGAEVLVRRAAMDKLLAIQTTSLDLYKGILGSFEGESLGLVVFFLLFFQ
ncbi:hypothetical protein K438DRAFT_1746895 [Mycena galopus ATCC 62051]|nr:hypothetical protein K438DRAFT_1746895 [Mycena galopus ATCC 62051]